MDRWSVQLGNKTWWTDHMMSYDWKKQSGLAKFTLPWFDDIDRRFLEGAKLFSTADNPFQKLMGVDTLKGKRVLEIGCGMGFHSELMARAGAQLAAIDLSPTSVEATRKRFELKGLQGDIRQMDAEAMEFPDDRFDLVWSWGVIHHSSRTGRIMRGIERVLAPGGEARIMVYNMGGMPAYVTIATRYLLGFWFGKVLDELLWRSTDGFSARFYSADLLQDQLSTFFDEVEITTLGQAADVVPLPRIVRPPILKLIPLKKQREIARARGAYLFAVAKKTGSQNRP
ncbi:MAG: class I SAM-dependent methyltransferase [Alphaproteobacteria bacterium]|nr:methyltransferase domain-containing protein [Alphaproteobacteria bacterium]MDE2111496.1 class I SAM-dependent methyltransferase [Alphaproteobacteria bacterium]MDE2493959.1 class I SAM-dependent methyltransferase [Alphaproteobacteria bacterium]